MKKYDYIVLGGGIIGMMTARELAQRGASVAIFDRGELGMESSWAAGGILSAMRPWAEHPASAELSEHAKKLYPNIIELLKDETGIDPEYVQSGLVIIEQDHVVKVSDWARSMCIKLSKDIQNISTNLKLPEQSILLPEISQLRPPKFLKALHQSIKQLSVSIFENIEITNITTKNGQFESIEFTGEKVNAGALIVTAGVWSSLLLGKINNAINIKPIHGQMLCVRPAKHELRSMILDDAHYFIPRLDGHVLIGSTMEDIGITKKITTSARQELLNWAYSIWPDLVVAPVIKHWSGLRPSTKGGKPYIGVIPDIKNIYINAGHFRKGILQAPSSAKLLVDYLSGVTSFMDIEVFSLEKQLNSAEFA